MDAACRRKNGKGQGRIKTAWDERTLRIQNDTFEPRISIAGRVSKANLCQSGRYRDPTLPRPEKD